MIADLRGLRILNTRPYGQQEALSQLIVDAGGVSIECPALAIEAVKQLNFLKELGDLAFIDQAIFISCNAVHYFFDALDAHMIQWPESIRVIAIGRSSAKALAQRAVRVDEVPLLANSEHLLLLDSMHAVQNQTIALVKGEEGRAIIAETLISRGARVLPINIYRRVLPDINQDFLHALWHDDAVDVIVFTSEQAIVNLFCLFDIKSHDWLRQKVCWVVSERLAKAAGRLGIKEIRIIKGLIYD